MLGKFFLIAASALFYCYAGWDMALVFTGSILGNYLLAKWMEKSSQNKKKILAFGIGLNILLLFQYKYVVFFLTTVNKLFATDFSIEQMLLPLGISFYTFQQIMYLVSVYRGELSSVVLSDYLAYILYFPKILMGPMAEPADMIGQINDPERKKINGDHIIYGIQIFSFGLFKKMVLAGTFTKAVTWGFGMAPDVSALEWILIGLSYTFEIYFDFSGYCDMATGVSKMLNIDLPINFDSPYRALSFRDFWKRWHLSLTGFLTRYLYYPLGGSRKGKIRTYINIMIIFLISGIWHGANWTYILWGIGNGLISIGDRIAEKVENKIFIPLRWVITFVILNFSMLLFRAGSVSQWRELMYRILMVRDMGVRDELLDTFLLPETDFLFRMLHLTDLGMQYRGLSMALFMAAGFVICLIPKNNYRRLEKLTPGSMVLASLAFVWAFLCLSSEAVFVYFNF